jgi:hypothetical protein
MASLYGVSAEAQNDLVEIWRRIADDSVGLADRIDDDFTGYLHRYRRCPGKDTLART